MSTGTALAISLVLLAGNAFFVAAEFALVASKPYRLEQESGRAARAALAGSRELSLMLAGAQLGVTICTLGLGALAEPALAHFIESPLHSWGLPEGASHAIGFAVALIVVVFLHMVVGEMAPKSWAITHPERSALLLALPFRAFARLVRPLLIVLNGLAAALLRLVRVRPQDQLAQVHGPEELAILVEQSRRHGTLEQRQHELLAGILALNDKTLAVLAEPIGQLVTVPASADSAEVEAAARASGRSRIAVLDRRGAPAAFVHVRDAIRATTSGRSATAGELATPAFRLGLGTSMLDAVAAMREHRVQLALVEEAGDLVGFVALEDLLEEVIGDFNDETDRISLPIARS